MHTQVNIGKSRYLHRFGLEFTALQSSNSDGSKRVISSEFSPRHVLLN